MSHQTVSTCRKRDNRYPLPAFSELRPAPLQARVMSKAQWYSLKQAYVDIEQTCDAFHAVVLEQKAMLMSDYEAAIEAARQEGMAQASLALLRDRVVMHRNAKDQQDELVKLMFATIETILGELPDALICARLAKKALNQQLDVQSIIAVTIHPEALNQVSEQVESWRSDSNRPRIELQTDADMASTDCEIETNQGTVRAGLAVQLAALQKTLLQAREKNENIQL